MKPVVTPKLVREACQEEFNQVAREVVASLRQQVTHDSVYAALASAHTEGRTSGRFATFVITCTPPTHGDGNIRAADLCALVKNELDGYLASVYDTESYLCTLDAKRVTCGYVFADLSYQKPAANVPVETRRDRCTLL